MKAIVGALFATVLCARSQTSTEVPINGRIGFSWYSSLGVVSPSGKWVFGVRESNDKDTVFLWRFGTTNLIQAYISKHGQSLTHMSQWIGDEKIYYSYEDTSALFGARAFVLDISSITSSSVQPLKKITSVEQYKIIGDYSHFEFEMASSEFWTVTIKTLDGKLLKELSSSNSNKIIWFCNNASNEKLTVGTYVYSIKQRGTEFGGLITIGN